MAFFFKCPFFFPATSPFWAAVWGIQLPWRQSSSSVPPLGGILRATNGARPPTTSDRPLTHRCEMGAHSQMRFLAPTRRCVSFGYVSLLLPWGW